MHDKDFCSFHSVEFHDQALAVVQVATIYGVSVMSEPRSLLEARCA
jgi:hypothetical protein